MTDREPTDTTLRDIANNDQVITEINRAVTPAGVALRMLKQYGYSQAAAERMGEALYIALMMQNFGIESHGLALNYFIGDTGEGEVSE